MFRGRLGYECCGELSDEEERLPPSFASGNCKAKHREDGEKQKEQSKQLEAEWTQMICQGDNWDFDLSRHAARHL